MTRGRLNGEVLRALSGRDINMRLHHFAGVWAMLFLPAVGLAQVVSTGLVRAGNGSSTPGGATSIHDNDLPINASNGNTISLTDTGDLSYQLSRTPQKATFNFGGILPFSVGPIPVQMGNLTLAFDLKKVNGGGTGTTPATTWNISSSVYEQLGQFPNPNTDPQILGIGQTGSLTGNGFLILNENLSTMTNKYVLAAGTNYYLTITDATTIDNTMFQATNPTVSFTNEYGGDLTKGTFTGYAASFAWQAVPEPATAMIIADCALLLLRRQRSAR